MNIVYYEVTNESYQKDSRDSAVLHKDWWDGSKLQAQLGIGAAVDFEKLDAIWRTGLAIGVVGRDIENHNELVAMYWGVVDTNHADSNIVYAREIAWGVKTAARKGLEAKRLLKEIEKAMVKHQVNFWFLAVPNNSHERAADFLLTRNRYQKAETHYMCFPKRSKKDGNDF